MIEDGQMIKAELLNFIRARWHLENELFADPDIPHPMKTLSV